MTALTFYISANLISVFSLVFFKRPTGAKFKTRPSLLAWALTVFCITHLLYAKELADWSSAGYSIILSICLLRHRGNISRLFNVK